LGVEFCAIGASGLMPVVWLASFSGNASYRLGIVADIAVNGLPAGASLETERYEWLYHGYVQRASSKVRRRETRGKNSHFIQGG